MMKLGALLVLTLAIATACGGSDGKDGVDPASTSSAGARSDDQSQNGAPIPDGELVVVSIDGLSHELDTIIECPATPGLGLGFNASTADSAVRASGGFEGAAGIVRFFSGGDTWEGGTEEGPGSLSFDRTDVRSDAGVSFVLVSARGTALSVNGTEISYTVDVVCEPGGS